MRPGPCLPSPRTAAALLAAGVWSACALAADTGTLSITATVLSKSNCKITTGAPISLDFPDIDPSQPGPYTATTTVRIKCGGSAPMATYSASTSVGAHPDARVRRMQNTSAPSEFLPYTISLSPATDTIAKNTPQDIVVTGTVTQSQYQNAYLGSYSDTVTLSVAP
jgi:hypothetical protein